MTARAKAAAVTARGLRGTVPREFGAMLAGFRAPAGACVPTGRFEVLQLGDGPGYVVRMACRCGAWHVAPAEARGGLFGGVAAVAMDRAGLVPGLVPVAALRLVRAGGVS